MISSTNRSAIVAAVLLVATTLVSETIRLEDIRDAWISDCGDERDTNMGAAPTMKIKFFQELGLADFDMKALKGKRIKSAILYVKPGPGGKFNLNDGTDLRWLSISTMSHDWVEGKGIEYTKDTKGNGVTYNESSYQKKNWGFPGAKLWDVTFGNGNTLRCEGELKKDAKTGFHAIPVDQRIVAAMSVGASYGISILDGSTLHIVNNTLYTRESKANAPYIVVEADDDSTPPGALADLTILPAPNDASYDKGAIWVTLTAPENAFAYFITINGVEVPRQKIPFAADAGVYQSFVIDGLEPNADVKVELTVVSGSGIAGAPVIASGKASPALTVPELPKTSFTPKPGLPARINDLKIWAFPEVTKIHPVSGDILYEPAPKDFEKQNAVWDGSAKTIRLAAARGEIISWQIAIDGKAQGCSVAVSDLTAASETGASIKNSGVRFWRNWYVNNESEYAIPLKNGETFDVPTKDNAIQNQKFQAVTVDYHIPTNTPAGEYSGIVTVSAGRGKVELPLKVKVYNVVIPDDINFNPELNCYGGPGQAGSDQFKESYQLAHYNRCTINRVPYSQGGKIHDDWAPVADSKTGKVTDWSRFDANLSGLLDGSWFKDNPRSGVPVPTLYLPLFEGWPLNFRDYYKPGDSAPMDVRSDDNLLKHYSLAKPIEDAMDPAYKAAWVQCVSDFHTHFTEKGWTKTIAQCYLNNKPNWGYTIWTLDEPCVPIDWMALNFFGRLWKEGINDPEVYTLDWHRALEAKNIIGLARDKATFVFRGDISRMPFQGTMSDGLMTIIYLGGGGARQREITRVTKTRMPSIMYAYGSCNPVNRANWDSAAWCLNAFTNNLDGVLPWQSLGGAEYLKQSPNPEGLIIDPKNEMGSAIASFRVHALRRGAQDCELLRLLQLSRGWSREHIGMLVSQRVPLQGQYRQAFSDEAAAMSFKDLTAQGFVEMKEGILQLIEASEGYVESGRFAVRETPMAIARPAGGPFYRGGGYYEPAEPVATASAKPGIRPKIGGSTEPKSMAATGSDVRFPSAPDDAKSSAAAVIVRSAIRQAIANGYVGEVALPIYGIIRTAKIVSADDDALMVDVDGDEHDINWPDIKPGPLALVALASVRSPSPELFKQLATLTAYACDREAYSRVLRAAKLSSVECANAVREIGGE